MRIRKKKLWQEASINLIKMKKVYVCSRYFDISDEEIEFNLKVARFLCRKIINMGDVPVAPHLYFPQFLNDSNAIERNIGMRIGIDALRGCQEYIMVLIDNNISDGMAAEYEVMKSIGIPGQILRFTKEEIEELLNQTEE